MNAKSLSPEEKLVRFVVFSQSFQRLRLFVQSFVTVIVAFPIAPTFCAHWSALMVYKILSDQERLGLSKANVRLAN